MLSKLFNDKGEFVNTELKVLTDTIMHISEVKENLSEIRSVLEQRGNAHDRSKFTDIEFDAFVSTRPEFEKANFGTPEYKKCTDDIKPAIDHHYSENRHHVKFFKNGFEDMNLIDIIEMLADWKAASRRSPDLTFEDSLPEAFEKYSIPETMQKHIISTLTYLGWIEGEETS